MFVKFLMFKISLFSDSTAAAAFFLKSKFSHCTKIIRGNQNEKQNYRLYNKKQVKSMPYSQSPKKLKLL